MHVPEILFTTYTPVPEDMWYTAIKAKSVIRPEGSAPLPAGFDETWSADEVETNPKLAAALARGDLVPRDVWNCADGKQRMSSIKRCVSALLRGCTNHDSIRDARRRNLVCPRDPSTDANLVCRFMRGELQIVRVLALWPGPSKAEKVDLLTHAILEKDRRGRHPLHVRFASTAGAQSAR